MTQSLAAGILGAIGLATAAVAGVMIWFILQDPIKVADAIARLL